jgi:hypothetical protein
MLPDPAIAGVEARNLDFETPLGRKSRFVVSAVRLLVPPSVKVCLSRRLGLALLRP